MPFDSNAVLTYIAENGPAVPNQIRQALGAQDNFVVGAVLSDLVSSGRLALTHFSYGSSKFYYDPSAPEKLEPLAQYLNEKDRRACELLRAEGVLRHSELSPLNRVAVAAIQDYSRPVRHRSNDGEELFWRYYLISETEAQQRIIEKWFAPKPIAPPQPTPTLVVKTQAPTTPPVTPSMPPPAPPAPVQTRAKRAPAEDAEASKKKSRKKGVSKAPTPSAEFSNQVSAFFATREITLEENLGSTKTEMSAIVSVPSAIGAMRYYCKAKTKKTTTDGDLAAAYLEAQAKALPLLYLAADKLSKKAKDVLPTLKGAMVAQLSEQ
jgi:hypothetical protein